MRLREAINLVLSYFKEAKIEILRHITRQGEEYFRLRARLDDVMLDIREYWTGDELQLYGYQLIVKGRLALRYNNAPHHPEVRTFPHHKHVGESVKELREPCLRAFLEEAKTLLVGQERGGPGGT